LRSVRRGTSSCRRSGTLELRCGDGLSVLRPDDRVDVVVISGLGGLRILEILENSPGTLHAVGCERLVLQPQTDLGAVRRSLRRMGFSIVDERLTRERGRLYHALAARRQPDAPHLSHPDLEVDDLLEAGPRLVRDRDPLLAEYWTIQLTRLERILQCNRAGAAPDGVRRQAAAARRILRTIRSWDA
jgi:tRNA (adenine22-N1)-methyltransferase